MMGRLVVDSVVTWAREYKVDGFRFDLMGHHPRANILEVRVALDHLTADATGSTAATSTCTARAGTSARWPYDARFAQATQVNMAGTGIGTFNDRLRDAVRGGGSFGDDPARARLRHRAGLAHARCGVHDRIKVGLAGGLATYRFVTHTGRRAERRADRLQRLTQRIRGRAGRDGQLRGRPRQRDPLRRDGVQAADRHVTGRPGPDAGARAVAGGAEPGRRLRRAGQRAPAVQVAGPQLVQLGGLVQPDPLGRRQGNGFGLGPAAGRGQRGQVAVRPAAAGRPGAGAAGRR